MKKLTQIEQHCITGGKILPGDVSNTLHCINIKLMIYVARGEAGFDEAVAALAYQKYCGCIDFVAALDYVHNGENDLNQLLLSYIITK